MAIGCIDTLRHEYDIKVPDEIAVVGFDGVSAARWASYELTTVVQPVERMVEATVTMLLERMKTQNYRRKNAFLQQNARR